MTEGYFSIKRDNELIAAGSHFWCQACVVGKTASEQSPDPRYCQSCFELLKAEAELQRTGRAAWMPKVADSNRKATVVAPDRQEAVAKIVQGDKPPITEKQVIMQHRGRPIKQGAVHRATRWRRAKQGVLL